LAGAAPESDALRALRQVSFLKGLDPASLSELADACRILTLEKGEDLFFEDEPSRGMFLVLDGSVKVYRSAMSGREQIIAIESRGALVAELPLLDGEPYPASCAALDKTRVLLLPRAAFEDLLRRRPEVAIGILRVVGRRLRHLVALIDELSLLEVPQRMAKYILETSAKEGTTFTLALSNQEIASRLGTVREIVSRVLHRLEQEDLIAINGRIIEVRDPDRLREMIESK
jgi:CRP-like cAMP-binding protein